MTAALDFAQFGRIAVLYGGRSAERAVSLRSGEAVLTCLQQQGADVVGLDTGEPYWQALSTKRPDIAFIALHGRGGEDGHMQAVLEELGIPYTGSGVAASAVGMDKRLTKAIWQGMGLPTPPARVLASENDAAAAFDELGPVVLKPALEGSSLGISIARTREQVLAGYRTASEFNSQVLAERFIDGPEYTVSLLDGAELPSIRMQASTGFYDYAAKYERHDTRYDLPSGLDASAEAEVQALSRQAFESVGCRGWGRVDLMRDQAHQWWLLEVNTLPGLTDHSLVPMAAKAVGMDFATLIHRILGLVGRQV